jgi:hypothetical protein
MTFNEIQYWRARAMRLEAALKEISVVSIHEIHYWQGVANRMQRVALKALSETSTAMDEATARAWRESDGDHRNHVEDRK